jgi:hypothetical protein
MMEALGTSETLVNFTRLHGATSHKTDIIRDSGVSSTKFLGSEKRVMSLKTL